MDRATSQKQLVNLKVLGKPVLVMSSTIEVHDRTFLAGTKPLVAAFVNENRLLGSETGDRPLSPSPGPPHRRTPHLDAGFSFWR
jgi:hypothetical protein